MSLTFQAQHVIKPLNMMKYHLFQALSFATSILTLIIESSANPCFDQFATLLIKDRYNAKTTRGGDNPLSFSYEIEFNLQENPNLVNYYRPRKKMDQEWMAHSQTERLALAAEVKSKARFGEVIFEKLATAPDFLAPTVLSEYGPNLEINANPVTYNLNEVAQNLDWIWEHMGAGSVQGHIAFNRRGIRLPGIHRAIKLDYDISQAQALVSGYASYLEKGLGQPGANLSHFALGPVGEDHLQALQRSIGIQGRLKSFSYTNRRVKYSYSISYRPDLYGHAKAGFEIRNCHKRLNCIKSKMAQLASDLEAGMDIYSNMPDSPVISRTVLAGLHNDIRQVYLRVGSELNAQYPEHIRQRANFNQRFLFAHLDWKNHPLIKVLQDEHQERFSRALDSALSTYEETVRGFSSAPVSAEDLQLATAKWAYDLKLDTYLEEGFKIIHQVKNWPLVDQYRFQNHVRVDSVFKRLFFRGMIHHQDLEKLVEGIKRNFSNHQERNILNFLDSLDGSTQGIRRFFKIADSRTINHWLGKKDGSRKTFIRNITQLPEQRMAQVLAIAKEGGLKTTTETPNGSWIYRKIAENSFATLKSVFEAMEELQLTHHETATFFQQKVITWLATPENHIIRLVSLLSGRKTPEDMEWAMETLDNLRIPLNANRHTVINFHQKLFFNSAEEITPIGHDKYLLAINDREYLVHLSNSRHNPFHYESHFNRDVVKRWQAEYKVLMAGSKVKATQREMLDIIKEKPKGVFLISSHVIHHQGLVLDGTVYSLINDIGIQTRSAEKWMDKYPDSTLVEFKANPEQRQHIRDTLESSVGKNVRFDSLMLLRKDTVNCTSILSCHLETSGIMDFPNRYVRNISKQQLSYLVARLNEDERIQAIYFNQTTTGHSLALLQIVIKLGLWGGGISLIHAIFSSF